METYGGCIDGMYLLSVTAYYGTRNQNLCYDIIICLLVVGGSMLLGTEVILHEVSM